MKAAQYFAGFSGLEGGVVKIGSYPVCLQGVHLVFHQRYQGAYDDADSGAMESRYLITEGFSPAGGHENKSIFAPDQPGDDFLLVLSELAVTEDVAQVFERCWAGGGQWDTREIL